MAAKAGSIGPSMTERDPHRGAGPGSTPDAGRDGHQVPCHLTMTFPTMEGWALQK
jgi:hypothetical protein